MPRQRSIYSTAGRTGGRSRSTNAQFARDVNTRLYGSRSGSTIPRVAAARSGSVPSQVNYETNRAGGRNIGEASGTHDARRRAIRASLGMAAG